MISRPVKTPIWLEPAWERKRLLTADRVRQAIEKLQRDRSPVSISKICSTIKLLFGVSISANTISRNPLARELYRTHRSASRLSVMKDPLLLRLLDAARVAEKTSLHAKISYLRRDSKDTLIAKLIESQRAVNQYETAAGLLRQEIMRLSLLLPSAPPSRDKSRE